ncbi:MAG: hypothetical protein K0R26_2250 [Bacteroidota bacterium]|jgi:uncharacterized membrane protein|nr:hypothetical protein [Bacteroidota bacterium]
MKQFCILLFSFLIGKTSTACTTCNRPLQEAIYNSTFVPNLVVMLTAFFVLAIIVVILARLSTKKHHQHLTQYPQHKHLNPVPLATASMVLGIGMGGFMDGIWFHQILQWHEMLSNKVPVDTVIGKSVNMFWDGIFHFFCLMVVLTGLILLWKLLFRTDVNRSKNLFIGGLLLGWGLFNCVEGIIDHQILKLHFVKQVSPNPEIANWLFLGISLLMILLGAATVYTRTNYEGDLTRHHNAL